MLAMGTKPGDDNDFCEELSSLREDFILLFDEFHVSRKFVVNLN